LVICSETALLFLAEQFLRDKGILRPATSTFERIIGEQRTQAQQHIFERITNSLNRDVFFELDALLVVGDNAVSPLQQLKAPPGAPSPSAMKELMDKLAHIEETGILEIDLSWLNNNYQRSLAAYVRQCDVHRLREVERYHRYGAMACFLWQTYQDTIKKRKREDGKTRKRERQSFLSFSRFLAFTFSFLSQGDEYTRQAETSR